MEKETFLKILDKYIKGAASDEEVQFLYAYYQLFELKEDVFNRIDTDAKKELENAIKLDIDKKLGELENTPSYPTLTKVHRTIIYKLGIAAVLAVLIGIGAFWLVGRQKQDITKQKEAHQMPSSPPITPGKDDAILVFADGTSIVLNEVQQGTVSHQQGVQIEKTADGELRYRAASNSEAVENTISTPKGGQYRLVLADGTKVWLNAASSLRFPTSFSAGERVVNLDGEAYFEVMKGDKPFKVISDNQVVEVLGTHFNINTYKEETMFKTTLVEGSVHITKLTDDARKLSHTSKVLRPGQQATLSALGDKIIVEAVDIEEFIAWKDGYFKFEKANIQTIMRQVARWYNVEVEYRGAVSNDLFVGEINRSEDIEEVLRVLRLGKINTFIEGRKVIISN
ncbi:FecR family protein [Sphingobacterium gobiense]|uniref:Anti-sigma factor n=1 Tax=Sphingobacterium gobiense TaxID=1382456 RepID=A0A2S9JI29_9SPHI|nr:FecR domain-containing protein [Sphingobacterium gobiense]PRD52664.1 hypothetical protein C5749_15670 [Sphingobacterium gobiense]